MKVENEASYIRAYQNDFFGSTLFYRASSEFLMINRGTIDLNIYVKYALIDAITGLWGGAGAWVMLYLRIRIGSHE